MDRTNDILNGIKNYMTESAERFGGKKRSELKDSDFLFPETKSFPIVTPQDVPDAISNFGRMKGKMSYDAFLRKLYNMAKRKGPAFVAALPEASKKQLGLKKKITSEEQRVIFPEIEYEDDRLSLISEDDEDKEGDEKDIELETSDTELDEYKQDFFNMSVGSLRAIAIHAMDILNNLENPTVKENLTASHLQGMIAVAEDNLRNIHDFVMFVDSEDDTEEESDSVVQPVDPTQKKKKRIRIKDLPHYRYHPMIEETKDPDPLLVEEDDMIIAGNKPGLWDNIRKKKEREGKNYRPAKPGDKDRPDPSQWKKLTK